MWTCLHWAMLVQLTFELTVRNIIVYSTQGCIYEQLHISFDFNFFSFISSHLEQNNHRRTFFKAKFIMRRRMKFFYQFNWIHGVESHKLKNLNNLVHSLSHTKYCLFYFLPTTIVVYNCEFALCKWALIVNEVHLQNSFKIYAWITLWNTFARFFIIHSGSRYSSQSVYTLVCLVSSILTF